MAAGEPVDSERTAETVSIQVSPDKKSSYILDGCHGKVEIVTLTREQSLQFYEIDAAGKKTAVLCDGPFAYDGEKIMVESPTDGRCETTLLMYPECKLEQTDDKTVVRKFKDGIWNGVRLQWDGERIQEKELEAKPAGIGRYNIEIPEAASEYKDMLLRIDYSGDIGHLFVNGELLSDNFCNGAVWEVGLKEVWNERAGNFYTILITPLKTDVSIDVSSTMAGRLEQLKGAVAQLHRVAVVPVQETSFSFFG